MSVFAEAYRKDRVVGSNPGNSKPHNRSLPRNKSGSYSAPPPIRRDSELRPAPEPRPDPEQRAASPPPPDPEHRSNARVKSDEPRTYSFDELDADNGADDLPTFVRGTGGTVTTFLPKEPPGTSGPRSRPGDLPMPKQPDAELDELLAELTDGGPVRRRSSGLGRHSAPKMDALTATPRQQTVREPKVFPWALVLVALASAAMAALAIGTALS